MRIGAHESIAGGLVRAFERADQSNGEAIQIFTTNGNQWAPRARDPGEVREFEEEARRRGAPVLAHDSYLINLAAGPGEVRRRSIEAFSRELERCEALGIAYVVMHPGAHLGAGIDVGLRRVADHLRRSIARTRGFRVRVLIELTAGQGTCLGHDFAQLGRLLDLVDEPNRTGVCFDTCHAFAAGYDLRRADGYDRMWREFDARVGLARLHAFHLNDSKRELHSRVDRHEAIGEGHIGDAAFKRLVSDPRFRDLPAVLELPPDKARDGIRRLKSWRPRRYAAQNDVETEAAHRR